MTFQNLVIVGNLGRDPEMRFTPSGAAVTNFSVASTEKYTKASGEKVEETVWMRVSVWGNQAEACNTYLKQGSKVLVEGKLKPINVYTKKDGTSGASYEMKAERVVFLGGTEQKEPAQAFEDDGPDDGDIPF